MPKGLFRILCFIKVWSDRDTLAVTNAQGHLIKIESRHNKTQAHTHTGTYTHARTHIYLHVDGWRKVSVVIHNGTGEESSGRSSLTTAG